MPCTCHWAGALVFKLLIHRRSPRKSAAMNRRVLFGLFLVACPGDSRPPVPQTTPPSPTAPAPLEPDAKQAVEDPACGALLAEEGCGDEVSFCAEPDQAAVPLDGEGP